VATSFRLPLPDPPLTDGVIRLRPWGVGDVRRDAEALAAAWIDPDVQRWSAVPTASRRSVDDAARWIGGEAQRRETGLALDLVISPAGDDDDDDDEAVLGEVGLAPIEWDTMEANVGWWVAPAARGRGIASRAVALLAGWARSELRLTPVADVDPANRASIRVAEKAGLELRP
jgi:RimJ/RimL family protein N-acetyltransferase